MRLCKHFKCGNFNRLDEDNRGTFRRQFLETLERGTAMALVFRHERIMLQFFPIILLRIAQKFPRLFSILFSTVSLMYSLIYDIFTDVHYIFTDVHYIFTDHGTGGIRNNKYSW